MDETKELLNEEIKYILEDLSNLPEDSEERTMMVDNLVKLYKLKIDENKNSEDSAAKKKDQYLGYGIDIAGIVLPLIFYGVWMGRGFKFEEKGTFTSQTFKGLINRFRPTK